jgi:hypothetical protein
MFQKLFGKEEKMVEVVPNVRPVPRRWYIPENVLEEYFAITDAAHKGGQLETYHLWKFIKQQIPELPIDADTEFYTKGSYLHPYVEKA